MTAYSSSCVRTSFLTLFILIFIFLPLISSTGTSNRRSPSPKQQFFPNGRYGRRSSMPALQDSVGGREMTVAFFGDGSVRCVYTGYGDLYKCDRKTMDYRPHSLD